MISLKMNSIIRGGSIGRVSIVQPRRYFNNLTELKQTLAKRSEDDLKACLWIQDLLNKTEGGGYLVSKAGMLCHQVAWGDHDDFQHVNNVTYLKWFETARVNSFINYGIEFPESGFSNFMSNDGVGPIIRSVDLAWRYPIKYPDTITVVHKLLPITEKDRFTLKGVVVSHNARKVAARITETIVTVDYSKGGIKAPIPDYAVKFFNQRLEIQEKEAPNLG